MRIESSSQNHSINFRAKFSQQAQAYIEEGLKYAKSCTTGRRDSAYWKEYYKFAKDTVKQIKSIEPTKYSVIDINHRGDRFLCNTYETAEAMNSNKWTSSMVVSNEIHNDDRFILTLMDLKDGLFKCSQHVDDVRYNRLIGRGYSPHKVSCECDRCPY